MKDKSTQPLPAGKRGSQRSITGSGDGFLQSLTSAELRAACPESGADPVLGPVLAAAVFLDRSLHKELEAALASGGRTLACKAGCFACCSQPIPLSLAEVLAIKAFLRLSGVEPGDGKKACPFLNEGLCAVYPVRPFACRRYLVFNQICTANEDPTITRPEDVLRPSQADLFKALCLTLPVYAFLGKKIPEPVTRDFFTAQTHILRQLPWPGGEQAAGEDG